MLSICTGTRSGFLHLMALLLPLLPPLLVLLPPAATSTAATCGHTYCGNVTISYPFSTVPGCGLPAFDNLLFCINNVPMLHLSSGSYRVLAIDYAYRSLTLHDPTMSTCHNLSLSTSGFVIDKPLSPYLQPSPNNVFLLLRCRPDSPLFQGFPERHLACRNVSGMGCDDYYSCPAWSTSRHEAYGSEVPPACCSVGFGETRGINLSRLECEGYSSAYSLAPLRNRDASEWSYGIRVGYTVPAGNGSFCRACEDSGGGCGYDQVTMAELCFCDDGWNSTSTCDPAGVSSNAVSTSKCCQRNSSTKWTLTGFLALTSTVLFSRLPFDLSTASNLK